jgi:hypothetical protein
MRKIQVAVIGIDFVDNDEKSWKALKQMEFLKDLEIHLVHVSSIHHYEFSENLNIPIYPSGEMKVIIEHSVLIKLNLLASEILPTGLIHPVTTKCLFGKDPKKKFLDYTESVGAQLVILSKERTTHFSINSFIQYQVQNSKANILVLKFPNEN